MSNFTNRQPFGNLRPFGRRLRLRAIAMFPICFSKPGAQAAKAGSHEVDWAGPSEPPLPDERVRLPRKHT
jgi:hypothetical protein